MVMGEVMKLMHVSLIVSDLDAAADFYEKGLGLERSSRPDLGFDGIFYGLEDGGQIHLMRLPDPYSEAVRPEHGGRDRHVALGVNDLQAIRERFDAAGISYTLSRSGRQALFCRDPDGNAIELMQVQG